MADSVRSEGDIPIEVAGSLVSERPTGIMANEVLYSFSGVISWMVAKCE